MAEDMSSYTLYGTDHSYFTGKVRPYLRYKRIPYQERQATLWAYQRVIVPRTGVRFIPVLQTPQDEIIQDTTVIIEALERRFPDRPILPSTPRQKLVTLLLEVYADEWFLLPGMHYRWSYMAHHENYLMTEFGRIAGPFPGPIKRMIGRQICKPFKNSLKFLGVTEKTIPAIEAWFETFLADFETHLAAHDYLLGSRPSLADFALAGPLYAHTWKDPYSRKILQDKAPRTIAWIQRINQQEQAEGAFLANDEVPKTLLPILTHLFAEQWPILQASADALPAWLEQHPEKKNVSRALGWHEFQVGQSRDKRLLFSNAIWMMQRPLDHYQALSATQRRSVDALLADCGGQQAMAYQVPRRVERQRNRLVAAPRRGDVVC
jgi:glutathione S-transferase